MNNLVITINVHVRDGSLNLFTTRAANETQKWRTTFKLIKLKSTVSRTMKDIPKHVAQTRLSGIISSESSVL